MFGLFSRCKFDRKLARLSDLVQVWPYGVTDKYRDHNYISYYDQWFDEYKHREVKVLEIGVRHAVSIALWDEFFFNNQGIWGIDIKLRNWAKRIAAKRPNVHLLEGESNDPKLADAVPVNFDIIIDDGSHVQQIQLETWKYFFPKLNPGGIYIIEDFEPIDDLDKEVKPFLDIWDDAEVLDRRDYRDSEDNVLIVYRKPAA